MQLSKRDQGITDLGWNGTRRHCDECGQLGAFVDVGVHQDGLVHISQLADGSLTIQQIVADRLLKCKVNEKLKRISLSMRLQDKRFCWR